MKKITAFTMAEAILVMTILGIIATIMISTLKPAQFKEKALQTMVRKVISEIDNTTLMIIMNDSTGGSFNQLKHGNDVFSANDCANPQECSNMLADLYKKYMTTLRQAPGLTKEDLLDGGTGYSSAYSGTTFLLKDGASVGIVYGRNLHDSFYPGSSYKMACSDANYTALGAIGFDVNDDKEPNKLGKDRFILLFNESGINWDGPSGCYCCSDEDIINNGCPMPACSNYE